MKDCLKLTEILEVSATAPSGYNLQPWQVAEDASANREFLELKEHQEPIMIIAIGYKDPNKTLLPRAYRFKFEEFGKVV